MMRLKSDLLPALLAVAEGQARRRRTRMARRSRVVRGHGRQGLSRRLRQGQRDQGPRCCGARPERADLPCRHQARRQPHPRRWRPRARRHGEGQRHSRGAGQAYAASKNRLAWRLLPPRHRLARGEPLFCRQAGIQYAVFAFWGILFDLILKADVDTGCGRSRSNALRRRQAVPKSSAASDGDLHGA